MRKTAFFYVIGSMETLQKIRDLLINSNIDFKEMHHKPTYTSEESAAERGEDLKTGGKAIVMKTGDDFKLFVIAADRKMNSGKIKKYFNVRKLRFATTEELFRLTGLVPGSVPPLGKPIMDLELFIDHSVTHHDKIAFNAGSLTDSIVMNTDDYLKVAQGTVGDFSG